MLTPAFSNAAALNMETGRGTTLVDSQMRFFCGYLQDDGRVVFNGYVQTPAPCGSPKFKKTAWRGHLNTDKPVFLTPPVMHEKGIGAAVFPLLDVTGRKRAMAAAKRSGLYEDADYYKTRIATKDISHDLSKPSSLRRPDLPGLASAHSCVESRDNGYASLGILIKKTWSDLKKRLLP